MLTFPFLYVIMFIIYVIFYMLREWVDCLMGRKGREDMYVCMYVC